MNNTMNNPVAFLLNAMRSGNDPQQLISNMAQQDPRAQQVLQILNGKNPLQQRQVVQNMARERGLDLDALARSLGIQIPSER